MDVQFPYEFIGFVDIDNQFPYEFTGLGVMDSQFPYEFIRFGATDDVTEAANHIDIIDMHKKPVKINFGNSSPWQQIPIGTCW